MKKTYLTAILKSFYDVDLYRSVVKAWKGMGYTYLFILSAIVAVLMVGQILYSLHIQISDTQINNIISSIPTITIQDGKAIADIEEPYEIPLSESRDLTFRIDMQSDPQKLKTVPIEQGFILYKEKFDIVSGAKVHKSYPLSKIESGRYDQEKMKEAWNFLKNVLPFVAFFPVAFGMWLKYIVRALVVTICSYLITAPMKDEYEFGTRMRMSAIALTPPIIIDTALLIGLSRPLNIFAVIGIAVLYIYVMIRVNSPHKPALDMTA